MPPIEAKADGIRLALHVQPRASRTELAGPYGDALRIRVASPPVDGAANLELLRFLAELLGVPRSSVRLISGQSARRKAVFVKGLTLSTVEHKLGLSARRSAE